MKHARYYRLLLAEGHLTRQLFWNMVRRIAVLSLVGGIAETVAGGIRIQSQEGKERCLTKPDRKAVVSSCGTRNGAPGYPCYARGPGQRKHSCVGVPEQVYSVWVRAATDP
ncbi:hypothetical protein BDD14_6486 [Edaphobacter modestus]|uniref:Uncharacterized protein n=1 Tax=Edaphobacter modestus TaxID=388466 RepID=A0A4Q7XZD8_9BACT|nr:hypothetical protein BDD14_6486 [Edaphobacter modestus]